MWQTVAFIFQTETNSHFALNIEYQTENALQATGIVIWSRTVYFGILERELSNLTWMIDGVSITKDNLSFYDIVLAQCFPSHV